MIFISDELNGKFPKFELYDRKHRVWNQRQNNHTNIKIDRNDEGKTRSIFERNSGNPSNIALQISYLKCHHSWPVVFIDEFYDRYD